MTILFDCASLCKPARPFGAGLDYHRLPPEPTTAPMPPKRVRWAKLDLAPLPDERYEPAPELTLSGAWALPGEDVHSWDFGHRED